MTEAQDAIRTRYHEYLEVLNARRFERLPEFVHDEVTLNGEPATCDQIVAELRRLVEDVPDFTWRLEDLLVDGDRVAARLVDTGTPVREWLGLAPGEAPAEFAETAFYVLVDGRFKVMHNQFDANAGRRHLGG
jgi:predicted ester cyclase